MSNEMYLFGIQGDNLNPADLNSHDLKEAWGDVSMLVMQRMGAYGGQPGSHFLILDHDDNGKEMLKKDFLAYGDQTGRRMGMVRVVGVQSFDGQRFGHVPNRKMAVKVQK